MWNNPTPDAWGHKNKTWNFHCCSFHVRRPSHCPRLLNGATRKSTPAMNIIHPYNLPYRYTNPFLGEAAYLTGRHKGCAYRHIPRTFIVAMFWQSLESCEVSWRQNKAPIERLIIMSWSPAQYPLQHFDVLPSHVSAWRGLQSNLYCWVVSLGWYTFQLDIIEEIKCKNRKKIKL